MPNNIAKIHQEVFNLLISYHRKSPSFLFTLRKLNRNSRLDKGYWFLGDDNYLTVSFWRGNDRLTRMPMISFTIKANGESYLEMNTKTVLNKTDYFRDDFIKQLGGDPEEFSYGYFKNYPQFGTDYIKSLEYFINNDKNIIDRAIREGRVFWPNALQYVEEIEPIWPGDFKKDLAKVQEYQRKLLNLEKRTGYLKYITVEKFGPIKKIEINAIPDDCRWIFLTGENGAGKTSVLKAIATGLCNNIDAGERVWIDDIRPFTINLGLNRPNSVEDFEIKYSDQSSERKWLPKGLAMYGPVRLFTQDSMKSGIFNTDNENIKKASHGLFNSIGLLKDLNSPLALITKPKYYLIEKEHLIDNIVENLTYILPNIFQITVNETEDIEGAVELLYFQAIPVKGKKIVLGVPFERLPSGSKSIAAIIIDLIIRFREQQPHVTDLAEYSGIVLIDEIDLHLHPKLQKELVKQLSDTFPNIQFIVTTHSPIPMLGAPKGSIFITVYKDQGQEICVKRLDIDITNMLPNTILSSPIFDFNAMASVNHEDNDRFITEDDYSEAIFYKILARKIKERTLVRNTDDSPSS